MVGLGFALHCIEGRQAGREEDEASETLERKPRELEAGQELGNRQPPSLSLSRLRHHCCSLRAASHYHMAVQVQSRVHQEPKASVLSAYKICDLAYKILKV